MTWNEVQIIYAVGVIYVLFGAYSIFDDFPDVPLFGQEYDVSKWLWLLSAILWPIWVIGFIGILLYMAVPEIHAWLKRFLK